MATKPTFTGVNVVVDDMDTSTAFYRLLGPEIDVVPVVWPSELDFQGCTAAVAWFKRQPAGERYTCGDELLLVLARDIELTVIGDGSQS